MESQKNCNHKLLIEINKDLKCISKDINTTKNDIKIILSLLRNKEEEKTDKIQAGWSILSPFRM